MQNERMKKPIALQQYFKSQLFQEPKWKKNGKYKEFDLVKFLSKNHQQIYYELLSWSELDKTMNSNFLYFSHVSWGFEN